MQPDLRWAIDEAGAVLVPKASSRLMLLLGTLLGPPFLERFWTTWRLPGETKVKIGYPLHETDPYHHDCIIAHELVHVRQFRPWWGPWVVIPLVCLLPLPILFSGRWFVERNAYLADIRGGRLSIDEAVNILWSGYGWCWPRPLMRRWFRRHL